ncbi:MAG: hypothetical protein HOD43_14600 [Candidatus Marinimicrobia bacterium]|jgi:hypothetical protein|nr:hypothetical protein [Candidatus Neomarinimicrobiota bacterium]MBT3631964.1 hypothetical protein [Candidatus Neomarinimicrobiota bacterium]MBT3824550.1 hypothetical protein [Candidatus Neomarinimicrobiota bacterium]MBT4130275.1 hypothetical protein [Candidatus Neomarinimicrobiota bacterium]MBT4297026.1 hypothetical protein [Candidatus Neomarinimicrobiota bacterium]
MTEMYLEMVELFFIVGALFALGMGSILFYKPEQISNWSTSGNKWYSGRKSTKPLDVMHETDSFYFSNHVPVGVTMMIVSLIGLFLIITRMPDANEVLASTHDIEMGMGLGILLESIKWFLIVSIILGFPVWGFLAFSPDKLKHINKTLNKWVSTRLILLPLEKMNHGFDNFVLHYHRFFGAIFILGAAFILFKFLV